jgi:hypothetical protein
MNTRANSINGMIQRLLPKTAESMPPWRAFRGEWVDVGVHGGSVCGTVVGETEKHLVLRDCFVCPNGDLLSGDADISLIPIDRISWVAVSFPKDRKAPEPRGLPPWGDKPRQREKM